MRKQNSHELFLASLLKDGDETAFDYFFKTYYSSLCVYAYRYLNNMDEAEEIVQDVFIKLWEKRDELSIKSSVKDYLFRAVHNKSLNNIKQNQRKQKYIDSTMAQKQNSSSVTEENKYAEFEVNELMKDTLNLLPQQCKQVFVLSRFKNLKNKEIAARLGISIKTVENQMGKALKIFRNVLKDYL